MKHKLNEPTPTSAAGENLDVIATDRGESLAKLSRLLGRNGTYLQQFVMRGVPGELDLKDRLKLSVILNCTIEELTNDKDELLLIQNVSRKLTKGPFNVTAKTGWIPELGKVDVKNKKIDFNSPSGGIEGMAPPTILIGVDGAYSTIMPDDAMQPAIPYGATVFVNPIRAPQPGEDIVIRFKDGTGTIRNLLGRFEKAGFIMVQQYNPSKELSIPLAEIESIHLIAATTRTVV